MTKDVLAQSFGEGGARYDAYRPGFPEAVAELVAPTPTKRVLDVGAGTGKFTRLLVDRAAAVVAVDPSASMLHELKKRLPTVDCRSGKAEQLPVADDEFDLVTVAQAFHWFDVEVACAEVRRALVPNGRLALIWNEPDLACTWDAAAYDIAHEARPAPPEHVAQPEPDAHEQSDLPGFTLQSEHVIDWEERISRSDYLSRWTTVSTFLAGSESTRATMLSAIEHVLDTHNATRDKTTLTLPHKTEVFLYRAD